MIQIWTDAKDTERYFVSLATSVPRTFERAVTKAGIELLFLVKKGASGYAGGPRVRTGRYRDSIRMNVVSSTYSTMAEVGTDEPYGDILEFGGITHSPSGAPVMHKPHPHFSKAMEVMETQFIATLDGAWNQVISNGK